MKTLELLFAVDVAVSGGGFKKLEALQGLLSRVQSAGEKLQAQSGQIASYQKLADSVETSAARLRSLQDNYRTMDAGLQASRQRTAQLSQEYDKAKQRVHSWQEVLPKNSMLMQTAIRREQELARACKASQKETAKLERERDKLYRQVGQQSAKLESEREALLRAGEAMRQAGLDTNNLAQQQAKLAQMQERLSNAQSRFKDLRSQLSWDHIKMDMFKAAAPVWAFKAPVQASMKFEQAMLDVAAVARPTAEEFTRLSEQAKFLGRTTQYTSVQAAEAQQNLIRSGMSVEQVIKAMPSVLQLASAEGLSIEDAGKFIAKGLGGMNLDGEMAGRLADVLSYTSAHANTDVTMLSEAFKVAAPTLSSQSYTMEEVASYLGILANKGFEGSEAGNALSSSMQRLAALPKSAQDAFAKLKLSPRDEKGEALKLPELMIRLYNRLKDKTEVQQLEYLSLIFGKNYGKQMIAFMRATAEGQTKTLENGVWNESFGWSKQSTDIRMNSLNGDIVALSSAWDGLMTRVGESISPAVRIGVQGLTTAINFTTELINKMGPLGDIVIQVSAAFAGWQVVKTVYKYASLAIEAFKAWRELHAVTSAIEGTTAACGGLSAMFGKISAMLAPLGAVIMAHPIIAIGTLIAAGVALAISNWEKLKAWWESWKPAPKTALEIQQTIAEKKEFVAKYGTVDFRPSIEKMSYSGSVPTHHASGGILTTPHFGLVAEAGPEAVIPLSNKSRGIPILEKAASLLGLTVSGKSESSSFTSNRFRNAQSTSNLPADVLSVSNRSMSRKSMSSQSEENSSHWNVAKKFSQIFSHWTTSLLTFSRNFSPSSNSLENFSSENSYSVKSAGDFIGQRLNYSSDKFINSGTAHSVGQSPVINITVNGAGQESQSLAQDIADKIREVLREISSLEERVSFA